MDDSTTADAGRRDLLTRASRRALHTVRSWPAASYALGPLAVAARDRGRGQPILVHQMGKVASTAIVKTLEGVTERPVYHLHFLSADGIRFATDTYGGNWGEGGLPWHVFESKHVSRQFKRTQNWDVITVVRDPVAKNISGFFQIAKLQYHLDPATMTVDSLRQHYLDTYDEHDRPLNWIDHELDAVFGTDTFAEPFPTEVGWQLIEGERARVAIIRYEDLARATAPAIEALLGFRVGELVAANKSSNKAYGDNQTALTDSLVLPPAYLDMMYESKYATHFYSDEERAAMRARWT
jgi:hypothetical protein